nr:reverse transcriptase domain-containing protein [Tanacetum cinerariifolium]
MLKAGKLSYLIKELKQNNGKEQPKIAKKGETPGKEKPLAILMEAIASTASITPLIGFSGEVIWPIGQIQLLVTIGDEEHSASAWTNFMVVRSPSAYNGIIRRPGVRKLQVVSSTTYVILKILVERGIITLKNSMLVLLECAMVSGPEGSLSVTKPMVEERIKVAINPKHPEQTVMIGSTLTEEGRNRLCNLLQRNLDIFAWKPADMTGIPRHITEHRINVREGCFPVKQKKRGQAVDRVQAIQEEVEKLVESGIMKEVHYHDWLSNPVMVKKHDDSWRTCIDFKDLKKACLKDVKMSRDVLTVGSTMRIPLLYRGVYSQWSKRFMNYLEEQTDGEAMINSIKNDKSMWSDQEKKIQKIDRLARSILIQGLPNDIYSLIDSNKSAKDLWDALAMHMLGFEYGEQDRKAVVLYECETFKATEGELLLDTYIRYLQVINDLKKCGYSKDNCELNFKFLNNLQPEWKQKEKVVVSSDSKGSDEDDFSKLKKVTALLANDFNRKKIYSNSTNNNLRTSSASNSANKKQEYVKSDDKKEDKKIEEKKRDMSKVKCYNCKKEGHFAKDCKKSKVKDYDYYKTKMLLAKKDKDEQVLLAKNHAWMESSSDSDKEINANMVFMTHMEKVLSDLEKSSSSSDETIAEVSYYTSESESESEFKTLEYYNNSTNYDLDTLSSVRRPKPSSVMWKKKGSSNTIKADLSSVNHSNLNKNVKRYNRTDLLSCNNSHLEDTKSEYDCNAAMHADCNSYDVDVNDLFVFDDVNIRISQVSKMPFRKKPSASLNMPSRNNSKKYLSRNVLKWLSKLQPLAELVAKWISRVKHCPDLSLDHRFKMFKAYDGDVVIGSMTIKRVYYVEGLDLLNGDRSSNLYTIALNEIASNSSSSLLAKASFSQSWLWHQYLSHLNFIIINNRVKYNLVRGLPKMKFEKDHLCSTCEQGKIHRKHHKSKTAFASNKLLYLLHMDLCGPIRIEIINGKRYVLVVVDDFSRYTWVLFFHSKDEASEQQNGVVKRRNQTLVEAARTMLTFSKLPLFLWAEDIATACFTQNRSIIHKRFDKTPYELINKRKPNIKFFHVFECRCYLLNDCDDVGKLKDKRDIEVFFGYAKDSTAFRVYNKRTHKIHESVNVNFDEISEMASKQSSLEPGLSNFNETEKSSNLTVSQVEETSKKDLEDLF